MLSLNILLFNGAVSSILSKGNLKCDHQHERVSYNLSFVVGSFGVHSLFMTGINLKCL